MKTQQQQEQQQLIDNNVNTNVNGNDTTRRPKRFFQKRKQRLETWKSLGFYHSLFLQTRKFLEKMKHWQRAMEKGQDGDFVSNHNNNDDYQNKIKTFKFVREGARYYGTRFFKKGRHPKKSYIIS